MQKLASFERGKTDAKETFQKVEFTEKCANNDEEGKNSFTQATENVDEAQNEYLVRNRSHVLVGGRTLANKLPYEEVLLSQAL